MSENLLKEADYLAIRKRIESLQPNQARLWGKMSVSQMLTHCYLSLEVPTKRKVTSYSIIGKLIGWLYKPQFLNEKPVNHNMPTSPLLLVKEVPDFKEKQTALLEIVDAFYKAGPKGCEGVVSQFFGPMTSEEWGRMQYKHLNHHLSQFGA